MSKTTITIGNFDGVHVGHQKVLRCLKERGERGIVFTFSNHPSHVLAKVPKPLLSTPEHKLFLLEKEGVELIVEPFTHEFSQKSAETFLTELKEKTGFTHLILGHDAVIGKDREGRCALLEILGKKLRFELEYLSPVSFEQEIVSSSLLRKVIKEGDFAHALPLLGRPYSICARVIQEAGKGKAIGFPTANLDVSMLCLPPFGVYAVSVDGKRGVANLGLAPTLHEKRLPRLEVHLLESNEELYNKTLDVMFLKFIRPEKKFSSVEELRTQIVRDIELAR
ncbi:MAG: riboflavin biosynthesis protein RibF [Chlamydiales bacterium]|nr:riboflavin biosynthesis protein RibF [Chlamydiales bacterium]